MVNEATSLEIEKIFAESDALIVVYPRTKIIELKRGSKNNGFAFALNNINPKDTEFRWKVFVNPDFDIENSDCEIGSEEAEKWVLQKEGKRFLPGNSDSSQNPELILFSVPRNAKLCIIPYRIKIYDEQDKEYAEYDVKIEIKK